MGEEMIYSKEWIVFMVSVLSLLTFIIRKWILAKKAEAKRMRETKKFKERKPQVQSSYHVANKASTAAA